MAHCIRSVDINLSKSKVKDPKDTNDMISSAERLRIIKESQYKKKIYK